MVPVVICSTHTIGPFDYQTGEHAHPPVMQVFLADAADLAKGKDLSVAPQMALRLFSRRLGEVLNELVGEHSAQKAKVLSVRDPLPSNDPSQIDPLHGVIVVLEPQHTQTLEDAQVAMDAFARRWTRETQSACLRLGDKYLDATAHETLSAFVRGVAPPVVPTPVEQSMAEASSVAPLIEVLAKMGKLKPALDASLPPPTHASPMIPLLISAPQNYSIPGALSTGPMYHDHLWLMNLNDIGPTADSSLDKVQESVRNALASLPEDFKKTSAILPLFEETVPLAEGEIDTRPDRLRGVMVRLDDGFISGMSHELDSFAQEMAENIQKATGAECVALSTRPGYDKECKAIVSAIKNNASDRHHHLKMLPGVEVNGSFEKLLTDIQSCVSTVELDRTTIPAPRTVSSIGRM